MARVVLHTYGTADPYNVAFFANFDFPRKMVSINNRRNADAGGSKTSFCVCWQAIAGKGSAVWIFL